MDNAALSWDDLRILLAVHRHQSLLAAGRSVGLSTSTTARRLERLEAALGRPLVLRSTSGTRLEPGALALVALAEQLELGLGAAGRGDGGPSGVVRVSTGDGFARPLASVLSAVRRAHPGLQVELIAESRSADIARGEADVGVRTARTSSALVVEKPLGRLAFALYASARLVEERLRGVTLEREVLERADFVGHTAALEGLPQNRWLRALGARRFVFRTNSDAALLEAVRTSQGVGALPELVGAADRELVRLGAPLPGPRVPVWAVFHRQARAVPRVRVVVDALAGAFRAALGR